VFGSFGQFADNHDPQARITKQENGRIINCLLVVKGVKKVDLLLINPFFLLTLKGQNDLYGYNKRTLPQHIRTLNNL
jgi:hypothetical protein